jgi:hypothetical protein
MDFHAVVETVIDGEWWVWDATRLAPRQTLLRIGTGRDAADVAFVTVVSGRVEFSNVEINAVAADDLPLDDHEQLVGFRAWFLRRDPDLLAVRRAVRVTVVACLGFYVCYYLVDRPVVATYALFAAVAMGLLLQIPGPGHTPLRGAVPVAAGPAPSSAVIS